MEVRHYDSTDSNQTGQFQNLILLHQGFMQGLGLVCCVATGLMLLIDDAIKPQQVRNNSQLCFCPNGIVFVLTNIPLLQLSFIQTRNHADFHQFVGRQP